MWIKVTGAFIHFYMVILFKFKCINNSIQPFTENRKSEYFNRGEFQI